MVAVYLWAAALSAAAATFIVRGLVRALLLYQQHTDFVRE